MSGSLSRRVFLAPHSTYSKVRTTSLDLLQMSEEMSEAVLPHAQCLGFIQTFLKPLLTSSKAQEGEWEESQGQLPRPHPYHTMQNCPNLPNLRPRGK